jgi:hypothetical protein
MAARASTDELAIPALWEKGAKGLCLGLLGKSRQGSRAGAFPVKAGNRVSSLDAVSTCLVEIILSATTTYRD